MAEHLSFLSEHASTLSVRNEFEFTLKLRLDSPSLLWKAAANRCLEQSDFTIEEIEDMIGPMADPSIEDCLMLLVLPAKIPGCVRLSAETHTSL